MTTNFVPQIRIFLASPGDVNEERAVALSVFDMLEYDPLFKKDGAGGVSIHAIAWDKPGGDTPMRATKTPQTAIKEGLPRPSECDVVVVLFWSRMGTPLPHPEYQKEDGSPYLSGTEWEFRDALDAERKNDRPITLVYRRTEDPKFDRKDRKAAEQYYKVIDFFDQFRDPDTGALLGGFNEYTNPEDFRQKLTNHLRSVLNDLLSGVKAPPPEPTAEVPPIWKGSPFPGLRAFTEDDAPIFFGRGRETSELIKRVDASRFVAVVAASGSGKSSLVAAGLIPRLKANAIVSGETGSKDWRVVRFTPGQDDNPLAAMFKSLTAAFPEHSTSPFMIVQERNAFVESVTADPKALIDICTALLDEAGLPGWADVLFFIDQFEELFTLVKESDRPAFIALLEAIATSKRLRCIVTMRSDFMATAIEYPILATLINSGNYVLAPPTAGALVEMVKRPAERAGLTWEDGLPERIQHETGSGSGALAVMAYALDELYHAAGEDKRLTARAYDAIGGVEGAIGKRAGDTFAALSLPDKDAVLKRVFRELVTVNESGTPTRQRASADQFDDDGVTLIRAFIKARLLVAQDDTVEVAHEALFRSWERLRDWVSEAQEDLILLRQVRNAAQEWHEKGRPDFLLWPQERLTLVYAMQDRLHPELNDAEQAFIEPEAKRLLRELETLPQDATSHERRRDIGDRLAVIGDPRPGVGVVLLPSPSEAVGRGAGGEGLIPDIAWLPVSGSQGLYRFDFGKFEVKPFFIAKYQVTYAQFQAFVEAEDGFENDAWWEGMPDNYQKQKLSNQRTKIANAPRDSVSWYQSVAFARWMDFKYRELGLFEKLVLPSPQTPLPTAPTALGEGLQDLPLKGEYRAKAREAMVNIARNLRQRQTSAEELLWECLRNRRLSGLKFRRQHPIANTSYVVDFFNYENRLIIELDGGIHQTQQEADAQRQRELETQGLRVLRIPNDLLYTQLEDVLALIAQTALGDSPLLAAQRRSGEGSGVRAEDWQIRLPTEWEWQWAAQGGTETRDYPWGAWQEGYANTSKAGMNRTTAVGMYPHGVAACGALDMAGNLYDWCQNDRDNPTIIDGFSNGKSKVLRGGSFYNSQYYAAASSRDNHAPRLDHNYYGVRLVVAAPISRADT